MTPRTFGDFIYSKAAFLVTLQSGEVVKVYADFERHAREIAERQSGYHVANVVRN